MVTVRAPATSANLGSGFDVFGAALTRPADVVTVEKASETTIEVTGVGAQYIPEDPEKNTVGAVVEALDAPARIHIDKGVRPASGLGSSAASAAGAAVALNRLYDRGLSRSELVPIAAEGEAVVSGVAHSDNVAPSILGGFTVTTSEGTHAVDAAIPLVVCLPDVAVSTRDARRVVPETASMDDLVETVGNAATLAVGMCRSDPGLVGAGMSDPVVTPERARLITGYDDVRAAAFDAGAAGVTVSGAGPAILAVCRDERRRGVAAAMLDAFSEAGIDARAYQTRIGKGTTVLEE
ncbi:homoserine kinase [Halorubrum saccharovorum DSM 1137]|uniref:Homoserine kinase n=1 Tax=Halorubrum saccharovorum DSM 1137 TaxID=1227484 RepID=M0E3T2_9EURY|nr:homoserine kinase [Halorubrum saccharovorum]ELZ41703.1 homoserine kinase [Halorubrum saccharovorum DSM 1137]